MPKVPDPVAPPAPPPQISSTSVLGAAENQSISAARASGKGFSGTILTGPNGLFDIGTTATKKPTLIGAGL